MVKIVDELLGTKNCEADERERINEMDRLERWFSFRKAVVLCALYSNEATL